MIPRKLLLLLFLAAPAFEQNNVVLVPTNFKTRPALGGYLTVTSCTTSATGFPCSPLAQAYSDTPESDPINRPTPLTTRVLGNLAAFYAPPDLYVYNGTRPWLASRQSPYTTTSTNLNQCRTIDGNYYPRTGAGLQQAIEDAAANGQVVCIPPNTNILVNTSTPIVISTFAMALRGSSDGSSSITFSGMGNLFNITGLQFRVSDVIFTSTATSSRANACVFNIESGGALLTERTRYVASSGTTNNGIIYCTSTGAQSSSPNIDHVTVPSTGTWQALIDTRGSSGGNTAVQLTVNDFVSTARCSDACFIPDTSTDTWQVSNSNLVNCGTCVNVRNTASGIPPRWIHFDNTFLECGSTSSGTGINISSTRDFTFKGGYIATCQTGISISGGNEIDIADNILVNIGQTAVNITGGAQIDIHDNHFDQTEDSATNSYDTIGISGSLRNLGSVDIHDNTWLSLGGSQPRYGINIGPGLQNVTAIGNDLTQAAFGTAAINNGSSGNFNVLLAFNRGASSTIDGSGSKVIIAPYLQLGPGTTVENLPSASSNPGVMVYVTDSTAISAEGQTCVGNSTNKALAWSNGSTWKCF